MNVPSIKYVMRLTEQHYFQNVSCENQQHLQINVMLFLFLFNRKVGYAEKTFFKVK